jgi:Cu2+-exporting ATPase
MDHHDHKHMKHQASAKPATSAQHSAKPGMSHDNPAHGMVGHDHHAMMIADFR